MVELFKAFTIQFDSRFARWIGLVILIVCSHSQAGGRSGTDKYESEPVTYLEQNWTPEVRQAFYQTPQGSHLIPLKFARVLKDLESGEKFFTSKVLKRYGFIPQRSDPKSNPLGLPIGLTIDGYTAFNPVGSGFPEIPSGPRQIGMNCAACHTNNLSYGNKTVRIDGGQSLLNFQAFVDGMDKAVFATAQDQAKLARFLKNAQKVSEVPESATQVRREFQQFVSERTLWRSMNTSQVTYGFGRTDAFGVIFNQVLAKSFGVSSNAQEPNAPVSYPVLWDTSHHDFVQWNGIASNSPENGGPFPRNVGQVLGVFGHVDVLRPTQILKGYCTSARRKNLLALAKWTRDLVSPNWPEEIFGSIDQARATRGRVQYEKRCLECHAVLSDTRSSDRSIKAVLLPAKQLGVDPLLGLNSSRLVDSGPLTGRLTKLIAGRALDAREPATILLKQVVAGAVAGSISPLSCSTKMDSEPKETADAWSKLLKQLQNQTSLDPIDQLPAQLRNALVTDAVTRLKARPLNGIWASPPFLHNGSIKNIYELLLPATERSGRFVLGCTTFDPVNLGYDCGSVADVDKKNNLSTVDTSISGSLNSGHEYGQGMTVDDRYDLIEYLKTL